MLNLFFSLVLVATSPAGTTDRVLGLLVLPEVFGTDVCEMFTPSDVLLYSAPGGPTVGRIRVDQHWTAPPNGGCEGLTVRVHERRSGRVSELPTQEYGYETPAAIVLGRRGRWFKIRLTNGAAWVKASARDQFLSLRQLFTDHDMTYATDDWDGRLASSPGGALSRPPSDPKRHLIGVLTPVGEEIPVDAFERPEPDAPVIRRMTNDRAEALRGVDMWPRPVFVVDRRPGWFEVAERSDHWPAWGSARRLWIKDTPAWKFTEVTDDAERRRMEDQAWGSEFTDLRVLGFRSVDGQLWVQVEFLSESYCDVQTPTATMRGWMPAHGPSGEPTIWFFARGC